MQQDGQVEVLPALECGTPPFVPMHRAQPPAMLSTDSSTRQATLNERLAQVNTWDDHDTFDGWGSYPPKLQNCPLFQAIFKQSQRFYSVFQLATTAQLAAADGFCVVPPTKDCPHPALNFASQLGPSLAVVAPDSRSQRSKSQILSDGTFNWIIMAVRVLSCRSSAMTSLRQASAECAFAVASRAGSLSHTICTHQLIHNRVVEAMCHADEAVPKGSKPCGVVERDPDAVSRLGNSRIASECIQQFSS